MADLNLKNRVAIITGGASGIGRSITLRMLQAGAHVVIADIDSRAGEELAAQLHKPQQGQKALFVRTDVTDRESVQTLLRATLQSYGRIDILVNNAGINIPRLLVDPRAKEEITEELFERIMAINVKGAVLCAQAVARHMLQRGGGGVIINMTSEAGLEGSEGQSAYAASKGALYALTRSWAKELGAYNIRVVGIAPGILEPTSLRNDEYERALAYTRGITVEELRARYEKVSVPLKRVGRLEEVADVACFLASDMASYITGTVINVSGGKTRA